MSFLKVLEQVANGLQALEQIERQQHFNSRRDNVKIRISIGEKNNARHNDDFFGFDEPEVTSNADITDLEYALSKMSTQYIRGKAGFDNRTAVSRVKLTSNGMKVKVTRGNKEEKFVFNIKRNWGFSLGDKFDAERLGIPMKTMEEVEKLYE